MPISARFFLLLSSIDARKVVRHVSTFDAPNDEAVATTSSGLLCSHSVANLKNNSLVRKKVHTNTMK